MTLKKVLPPVKQIGNLYKNVVQYCSYTIGTNFTYENCGESVNSFRRIFIFKHCHDSVKHLTGFHGLFI